jgi:hypothetical protein
LFLSFWVFTAARQVQSERDGAKFSLFTKRFSAIKKRYAFILIAGIGFPGAFQPRSLHHDDSSVIVPKAHCRFINAAILSNHRLSLSIDFAAIQSRTLSLTMFGYSLTEMFRAGLSVANPLINGAIALAKHSAWLVPTLVLCEGQSRDIHFYCLRIL